MNRRDEVKKVIGDWIVRKHQDTERMCDQLDRIYGVLPDDGEVLTGKWLKAIGGTRPMAVASQEVFYFGQWSNGFFQVQAELVGNKWYVTVGGLGTPVSARGQFRRLCEALGVELKEVKVE